MFSIKFVPPSYMQLKVLMVFLILQIYDSPESDLKLNDVFEFVGVLTFDPEFTADKDISSDELANSFYEDALVHLPSSKVLIYLTY